MTHRHPEEMERGFRTFKFQPSYLDISADEYNLAGVNQFRRQQLEWVVGLDYEFFWSSFTYNTITLIILGEGISSIFV